MTILTNFAKVLKETLRKKKEEWTEDRYVAVGCTTCGDYDIVYDVDMEALDKQIDELVEHFQNKQNAAANRR